MRHARCRWRGRVSNDVEDLQWTGQHGLETPF